MGRDNIGMVNDAGKQKVKPKKANAAPGNLEEEDFFDLVNLFFKQKNIMYAHLYNSYNKFIDEDVYNRLTNGDNVFYEKATKTQIIKYRFKFNNISIKPPMTDDGDLLNPNDARKNNLSYLITVLADVTQEQEITDIATGKVVVNVVGSPEKTVPVASVPCMLRSKYCSLTIDPLMNKDECDYNPGGYFIVNGAEKVVISMDQMCENKPLVFAKKDGQAIGYSVQVNSKSPDADGALQIMTIRLRKDNVLVAKVPILAEVPVTILLKALGIESDRDIIRYVTMDSNDGEMANMLRHSLSECKHEGKNIMIQTKDDALEYLTGYMRVIRKYTESDKETRMVQKKMHLQDLLDKNFLQHMTNGPLSKGYYLCYMINRLLNVALGRNEPDDRDSYINKRVELPGDILYDLYKQFHKKLLNECKKYFDNRNPDDINPFNIISQIKGTVIELGIKKMLLTGSIGKKKGVAQMLQCLSYMQIINALRRLRAPTSDASTNKLTKPRHFHTTQVGFLAGDETPEGINVGLVKHLSLSGTVTIGMMSQYYILKDIMMSRIKDLRDVPPLKFGEYRRVFLNGEWLGLTDSPTALEEEIRSMKLKGTIEVTVSVTFDIENNEVRVYCDGGRLVRPLLRVENNELLLTKEKIDSINLKVTPEANKVSTWNEFIANNPGVVEYITIEEIEQILVAQDYPTLTKMKDRMESSINKVKNVSDDEIINNINRYDDLSYVKFTHCEIHPVLMLGCVTSSIPYANHNQGPRVLYQYSQARQGMGIYATNYRDRLDISYILHHPQRPITMPRTLKYSNLDVLPCGENCIVAIMCYTGYNQEDSVIMNQTSIDRGIFRATAMNKHVSTIQKNQSTSQDDMFTRPDPSKVIGMKFSTYDKINDEGYAPEETVLNKGDITLAKVSPVQPTGNSDKTFKDNSEIYKYNVPGTVDRVYPNLFNHEGYGMMKMRIRSNRIPQIGDKMACYDPETEVLTDKGWVFFEDLDINIHKVATLVDDNKIKYEHPSEKQEYNYDGDIYCVKSNQVDLMVTPNHRMYVACNNRKKLNYKIERADKIHGLRRHYKKDASEYIDIPKSVFIKKDKFILPACDRITCGGVNEHYDKRELDLKAFLILFGIWMAEGCTKKNHGLCIATHKQRVKDKLDEVCPILGLEVLKRQDKKTDDGLHRWIVTDKQLLHYMEPLSVGAINKYLPDWVWSLKPEYCRDLIEGMMLGDGHNSGCDRYDTSSKRLANDFQKLCLHAGWSANSVIKHKKGHVRKMKSGYTITCNADAHRLTIVKKQNNPLVNKYIREKGIQLDKMIKYNGKVYCCTTTSGVIYVRRKGIPVWCGQSRSGQKGVIGLTLNAVDMPFTKDGIVPDIIMNPNAFPKRMTVGQFIENMAAKVGAMLGHEMDATTFGNVDTKQLNDILTDMGYEEFGTEYLYNGMTGKRMPAKIYIGPVYYMRLKHMVADKIHARAKGPRTQLTRQPLEGRAKDGGLRFGEMERDCIISYGMAGFLKERMMETADAYTAYVCDVCGLFAQRMLRKDQKHYATKDDIYWCKACKNKTRISKVRMPYACKLLFQELMSMCIAPRIRTRDSIFD